MKKIVNIILSAAAITGIVTPAAASSKTEVRETIELVSALARTADFREYKTNIYPEYTAMIDSVTAPYKNHPAVTMIKSLRDSLGLGYDAVAGFAGALAIKDGNVVFNPELDYKPMIDRRWGETGADELVPLLNDFYHKTNFNEVYRKGQPIYEKAIANFNKMLDGVDMKWLSDYYGKEFTVLTNLSMLNVGNYGVTQHYPDGREEALMIIGPIVRKGEPDYSDCTSLVVHESSHPITNPIIMKHLKDFNSNSDSIASRFNTELKNQAYAGGQTVLFETMVRLAEVQYAKAHAKTERDSLLLMLKTVGDKCNGFLFLEDFAKATDRYQANRDKYPTLDDFMPELVKLHNSLNVDSICKDIESHQPNFIGSNIEDNAVLPAGVTEITLRFDKPIHIGQGLAPYRADGREFPRSKDGKTSWNKERTEFTYTVTLEPGKKYGISYPGEWFKSGEGYPTKGYYILPFETAPETK